MVNLIYFIENHMQNYLIELLIVIAVINLILAVLIGVLWGKFTKINNMYHKFMKEAAGENFEEHLLHTSEKIGKTDQDLKKLMVEQISLKDEVRECISKVGIVRYNAFNEMGSDLSFSVALLDQNKNGLILTSLYGRTECRTYAKPIADGTSTYPLSDEELEALKKALI